MIRRSPVTALALCLAILVAGCNEASVSIEKTGSTVVENPKFGALQDGPTPITFEVDQVFGAEEKPDEAVLGHPSSPVVDDRGNLYVLDESRVVSFTRDGAVRWSAGRTGQGPGEIRLATSMVTDGELLFVSNQRGTRIDEVSLDGVFGESISVSELGHDDLQLVGFVDENTLIGRTHAESIVGARFVTMKTNDSWRVVDEFDVDRSESLPRLPRYNIVMRSGLIDRSVVTASPIRYELLIQSPAGDTMNIIRRDVDVPRPGIHRSDTRTTILTFFRGWPPIALDNGYYLVEAEWFTGIEDPDDYVRRSLENGRVRSTGVRSIDLYDPDWKLLYSLDKEELADIDLGRLEFADADGFVYGTHATPYPRVVRYRVSLRLR